VGISHSWRTLTYCQVVYILSTVVDCGSEPQVCFHNFGAGVCFITPRRSAGKGIFSMHPSLEILYYRMLGARIGKNVHNQFRCTTGEFDLLNLQDECQIDESHVRGFRVERNGYFRLDDISIDVLLYLTLTHRYISWRFGPRLGQSAVHMHPHMINPPLHPTRRTIEQ